MIYHAMCSVRVGHDFLATSLNFAYTWYKTSIIKQSILGAESASSLGAPVGPGQKRNKRRTAAVYVARYLPSRLCIVNETFEPLCTPP